MKSKKVKNTIVPKLRFPEFRDDHAWIEKSLKQISPLVFDGTHQTPKYTEEGIPFFSVENIVSGSKNKFISKEDYLLATNKNKPEKGDILMTRIGNIGFSTVVNWDYEFSIYVTLAVIKKSDQFDSYYLHYFFQSALYQSEIRSKSLLNAVPCKINMEELRQTKVLLPLKIEQQKIADCLSSLDELISAQSQKLEALKIHKKGLMQQLFPNEGKTIPKLRFPEFRDAGEWDIKLFENLYLFKTTNSFSRDNLNYNGGLIKNIHYGDIHTKFSTLFYIEKEIVPYINTSLSIKKIKQESYCKEGDIIFADASEDLDGIGKSIEIVSLNDEKLLSGLHTLLARQKKKNLTIGFGGYLFLSNGIRRQIQKEAQGAKVLGISSGRLSKIRIYYPQSEEEQQKIADCLSLIDEIISVQNRKLETLKIHKKGLMQQLFPNLNTITE
jgi:type I restriction enzyme S subunit